jgi:alkylhydroperoxidase family enzyme
MSMEGLKYVLSSPPSTSTNSPHKADTSIGIDAQHAAILSYTDYMTLAVEVPDEVFAIMKQEFSEREIVEITATVGTYNCVSRFLVALDVSERNGTEGMEGALKHVSEELVGVEPASR